MTHSRAALPMTLALMLAAMSGCETKRQSQVVSISPKYDSLHAEGLRLWQPFAASASLEPDEMTRFYVTHESELHELNRLLGEMEAVALHVADSVRGEMGRVASHAVDSLRIPSISELMALQAKHHRLEINRNDGVLRFAKMLQECGLVCEAHLRQSVVEIKALERQIAELDSIMEAHFGRSR